MFQEFFLVFSCQRSAPNGCFVFLSFVAGTMRRIDNGQGSRDNVPCGVQRRSLCIPPKKSKLCLRSHRDSGQWTKIQSLRLFSDEKIHLPLHKGGKATPPVIASLCNRRGNLVEMIALFYMRLPHFTSFRSQ